MATTSCKSSFTVAAFVTFFLSHPTASGQRFSFSPRVKVQEETRIDWVIPVLGRSYAERDKGLLKGYRSDRQKYVLYGPANLADGREYPLILFVSFRNSSFGWDYCRGTWIRHGVVYAEPLNAGNRVRTAERVRIILDVLDDVRRRIPIDPDRTYIMGYSGGGAMAALISKGLPSYFGGALLSSGHLPIPKDPWNVRRLKERWSLSMHAGSREMSLALGLEHVSGPLYQDVGIRSRYQIHKGMGHAMVPAAIIEQEYQSGSKPDYTSDARWQNCFPQHVSPATPPVNSGQRRREASHTCEQELGRAEQDRKT